MAAKFPKIGTMIEKRDKTTGAPILDKDGKKTYYLKVDKDANITIDGVKLAPGSFINVTRPYDYDYRKFHEKGQMAEEDYMAKKAEYEAGGSKSYFQFELSVKIEK